MERLHVFVDEFGDTHLDVTKDGVSSTYIVAAVCVRDRALAEALVMAEAIRRRHFQTGEMKSSLIGSNDGRRLQVLRELSKIGAFVIAFCARKKDIDKNTGLKFKKSFIKYFAGTLYKRVNRCSDDLQILIDEHGSSIFREELKAYLDNKFKDDLFASPKFDFGDSENHVLLQVADLFAGSLARVHDDKKISDRRDELTDALERHVSVTIWPSGREEGALPATEFASEDDENVRRYCMRRAEEYLDRASREIGDRDEIARAAFLDSLLAHHSVGESGEYLSTSSLKREVSAQLGEQISDHRFRSAIVAKLRDADVIISSCSKGYRIPTCVKDVVEFSLFANSLIPPMVARVARAKKGITEATLGRVDMLDGSDFRQLQAMVKCVE